MYHSARHEGGAYIPPPNHQGEVPTAAPRQTFMSYSSPQLPRMPPALTHVASSRCYEAIAGVMRSLGHLMRRSDDDSSRSGQPNGLKTVVELLLARLREVRMPPASGGGGTRGGSPDGEQKAEASKRQSAASSSSSSTPWQLEAAATVAVLAEVLYGASDAWTPPFGAAEDSQLPQSLKHTPISGSSPGSTASAPRPSPSSQYENMVLQAVQEIVRNRLWGIETHNQEEEGDGITLPLQVQLNNCKSVKKCEHRPTEKPLRV